MEWKLKESDYVACNSLTELNDFSQKEDLCAIFRCNNIPSENLELLVDNKKLGEVFLIQVDHLRKREKDLRCLKIKPDTTRSIINHVERFFPEFRQLTIFSE